MVKLTAPAMSLDASGSLAGSITFAKWKGRNYARQLVVPANPKSGKQVGVRAMFRFLAQAWAALTAGNKASWEERAATAKISAFNAYVSENQANWRNTLTPTAEFPAAETSTAPSKPTLAVTGGVRQVTVELTHGANAPDWGYVLYRSTTGSFTPALDNAIAVLPVDGSGDAVYTDTPLAADTYYYRALPFMADRVAGTISDEENAVVT